MNYEYIIHSPCKLNYHLDVHNKREDYFHDLTSIFQLISLEDLIYARFNKSNTITISGDFDCITEDNLIYKAASRFMERHKSNIGISFKIDKIIPAGGGVGGGSGNAGAVLRFLNEQFPTLYTDKELFDLALSLGSDVPFFLVGGTALVQGRGEIIDKIPTFTQNSILLVNPSIHISTKNAFLNLHKKGLLSVKNSSTADNVMKDYLKGAENFNKFKNSFEIGLFSDYTFINDVKTIMLEEGAVFSALTGSGSTMFGIFDNSKKLENAKNRFLHRSEYNIYMVKPLDKLPGTEKRVI